MKKVYDEHGNEYHISIKHGRIGDGRRYTAVFLKQEDRLIKLGRVVCDSRDQFCKRTGRKLATTKLLQILRSLDVYSKEFRREVFFTVCPEYKKREEQNV